MTWLVLMARPPRFCAELGRYTPSDAAWGDDPRNHLSEIGGADPLRREGLRSGKPAVARQHRAPPGSRTTTVLRPSLGAASKWSPQLAAVDARDRERPSTVSVRRPSSGAASKSSSRDRGVPTPSGGASKSSSRNRGVPTPSGEASKSSSPNRGRRRGVCYHPPERVPGEHAPGARYFGRPKPRPEK